MSDDLLQTSKRSRGRPKGAVKSDDHYIRDRVRTVGTLSHLLSRSPANNVNQFAEWFDRSMRERHPRGRDWDTAATNKWRKNFCGQAALSSESCEWLSELFPGVTVLFTEGPGKLWQALWKPVLEPNDLWDIYDVSDAPWGAGVYSEALEDLCQKVFCGYDFSEPISEVDLGRAVVLYRLNEQFGIGSPEEGVDAYLCVRAALCMLADCRFLCHSIHYIVDFLAAREEQRIDSSPTQRVALGERWCGQEYLENLGPYEELAVIEYLDNPFHRMALLPRLESGRSRWEQLAKDAYSSYRWSKLAS